MLRFKKRDGTDYPEWEESSLENECEYVDYRGKTPTKTNEGVFLITAKNIRMGYIDYECSKEFISIEDYHEVMHRGLPQIGDVLITTEAPCGNVAQIDRIDVALAQRVIKYRTKGKIDNTYLKYYMLSSFFQRIILSKSTGGTVKGIKGSVLHKQKVMIPCKEEQRKISSFLSSVDEVISAIESEVALWEEKKKGVMQKIFSQEVRFKKEDGSDYPEWDELMFSDFVELSKEKYNPKSNKKFKCIELENIEQGTGIIKGHVDSSEQNSIKNVFHRGNVLFGKLRPYLRKYARPDFDGVCSSEIWVLCPIDKMVSADFLYCLVSSDAFIAISNISSGTKMPRADWKLVSKEYFEIPSLEEQKKIADCVFAIDDVIRSKKQKLDIWKAIKKGLLQQMFV